MHACAAGSGEDVQSLDDQLQDVVMMRLRTVDGLDLDFVRETYGSDVVRRIESALEPHERAGLVLRGNAIGAVALAERGRQAGGPEGAAHSGSDSNVVRLADPEGFLVSNDIISDVFAAIMP
jgi:oxygen-independent coproporphyrinogen-3 oxidase